MKFLTKTGASTILQQALTYKEKSPANNKKLLTMLISEQFHFCAYTEKYITSLDSPEVEHFNSAIKYSDDYYNYYAVLRSSNLYKKEKEGKYNSSNAAFFTSLFFQDKEEFERRIKYENDIYQEIDPLDQEAIDFIDYLGLNNHKLYEDRLKHIKRLKETFSVMNYSREQRIDYFKRHPYELNFITAIEIEFGIKIEL